MSPMPAENALPSWWRSQLHQLDDFVSSQTVPTESDVVIIGAGISGASVAYHLLQQHQGLNHPRIVILEARQACSGATGRNGGHLKPDPYSFIGELAAEYGPEAAEEVAEFERSHVDVISNLVKSEGIECDLVVTKAIDVQLNPRECKKAKASFGRLPEIGVKSAERVTFTDQKEAEMLVLHILGHCVEQGASLYTHTPAQYISPEKDESDLWTIDTPRGMIKSKHVVFASNAYTSAILPMYSNKIVPVRGVCCRIVPTRPVKQLTETYTLRWSWGEFDYLIPREDGSVIVGGAWSKYHRDTGTWYNNANDNEMIDSAKEYFDGYMQRNFHGWEESGAHVDQIWTGIMGYSADSLPHIGRVPGRPGQFIMAGFTGHGMPQAWLSGKGIAAMVSRGIPFMESGIPRIFETTQARIEKTRNDILEMGEIATPNARL